MKQFLRLLLLMLLPCIGAAQNAPMEPQKAAITSMKDFEDFPVGNTSGIPDISIPLFSTEGLNGFPIHLALQYNLYGNTNAYMAGSQFGSAWNLTISGVISRKVRAKNPVASNTYAYFDELFFTNSSESTRSNFDIYTFNVPGLSGKFYLKKENGRIAAQLLESDEYAAISVNFQNQVFSNFRITDKNGTTYFFDLVGEEANNKYYFYTVNPNPTNPGNGNVIVPSDPLNPHQPHDNFLINEAYGPSYASSWVLTKVTDKYNQEVYTIEYEKVNYINAESGTVGLASAQYIKRLNVNGKGMIEFTNVLSTNYTGYSYASHLVLKDPSGASVKQYEFVYLTRNYSLMNGTQFFRKNLLKEIREFGTNNTGSYLATQLSYKDEDGSTPKAQLDGKGFLIKEYSCSPDWGKEYIMSDVLILQKIKYPTGGCVLYQFEPNTYSVPAEDYLYGNADNTVISSLSQSANTSAKEISFSVPPGTTELYIASRSNLTLYYNNTFVTSVSSLGSSELPNIDIQCYKRYRKIEINNKYGTYVLKYQQSALPTVYIKGITFLGENQRSLFMYNPGNRIKKTAYYAQNVAQTTLQNGGSPAPEKAITYSYHYFDNTRKSSGIKANYLPQYLEHKPDFIIYENVAVDVTGIGTKKYYYDEHSTSLPWYYIKQYPRKVQTFSNTQQLEEEVTTTRLYQFINGATADPNIVPKPLVTQESATLSTYEGGAYTEQQHVTDFDPVHRYPTQSITTLPALSETHQQNHTYSKLGNVYVKNSSTVTTNGIQTSRAEYTYNAQADLLYQQTAKGSNALEKTGNEITRITQGRVEEYWLPNGVYVAQVWGYNNTAVVAELKNVRYSSIASATLTAIRNASSAATYNPTNLVNALNQLRAAHTEGLVTTYTYKPQVGLSSSTDANGLTTTYLYDDFNRLYQVIDPNGKAINRYEYNFKN